MLGALVPREVRSWWWRLKHDPRDVGKERPQVATEGSLRGRVVAVNHMIPVADETARAFPRRKMS
jgi:hypothetical protein